MESPRRWTSPLEAGLLIIRRLSLRTAPLTVHMHLSLGLKLSHPGTQGGVLLQPLRTLLLTALLTVHMYLRLSLKLIHPGTPVGVLPQPLLPLLLMVLVVDFPRTKLLTHMIHLGLEPCHLRTPGGVPLHPLSRMTEVWEAKASQPGASHRFDGEAGSELGCELTTRGLTTVCSRNDRRRLVLIAERTAARETHSLLTSVRGTASPIRDKSLPCAGAAVASPRCSPRQPSLATLHAASARQPKRNDGRPPLSIR